MFAAFTGTAEKENGDEGWLSRAVGKVSRGVDNITNAASSVSARTVSLLDFRSGATDVICLRSEVRPPVCDARGCGAGAGGWF